MILSLIVAMDESGGIGYQGKLPWRLAADLKRFKHITMGHHVIMGRKTYESIGKALPGRDMLILSRDQTYQAEGCLVIQSLEEALQTAKKKGEKEVFIIGGGELFAEAINFADKIYLTLVHVTVPADVFFPKYSPSLWEIDELHKLESDQNNEYAHTFMVLSRKPGIPKSVNW